MSTKLEVQKFTEAVTKVCEMIENYEFDVKSYAEFASENARSLTFLTNKGPISLATEYDKSGKEHRYTLVNSTGSYSVDVKNVKREAAEERFEDIENDLKSLFYEKHYDMDDVPVYETDDDE